MTHLNVSSPHVSRLTPHALAVLARALTTGCSNIIRSGLMNSNTIFLDPNMNRTAYLQLRNTSENQHVTLNEVQTKLTTKGYQLIEDPEQANYWIQAKVVYCHKAAEGVTPESVAKAGLRRRHQQRRHGDGLGRNATGEDQHGNEHGMPWAGHARHERHDGAGHGHERRARRLSWYADATGSERRWRHLSLRDRRADYRSENGQTVRSTGGGQATTGPKVQQMRMVGHVRQKDLDIPEATPIIQEKISTGIAGLF